MDWWGRESTSTAGPKRWAQADSQLGNASKPDLKTHGKQSSHSCTDMQVSRSNHMLAWYLWMCPQNSTWQHMMKLNSWSHTTVTKWKTSLHFFPLKTTIFFKFKILFFPHWIIISNFKELSVYCAPYLNCFSFWLSDNFYLPRKYIKLFHKTIDVNCS